MSGLSTEIVGITAGIFTATSMLPQLVKILKEKQAGDISIFMLVILLAGLSLWVVYGIQKTDMPIVVTNSFSFLLNLVILFFRMKYNSTS